MLNTQRLFLNLLEQKDEYDIVRWRNQKDVIDNLFTSSEITIGEHREWYESYINSNTRIEFVIVKKEDNKKIGTIGLSNIDYKNQKAEYGILLGEKEELGKGYAKEASIAIINYGFFELNLQRIYLKVFTSNLKALGLYKKLEFVEEGILRKDVFKNGEYRDVMVMSILINEWKYRNV